MRMMIAAAALIHATSAGAETDAPSQAEQLPAAPITIEQYQVARAIHLGGAMARACTSLTLNLPAIEQDIETAGFSRADLEREGPRTWILHAWFAAAFLAIEERPEAWVCKVGRFLYGPEGIEVPNLLISD